MNGKWSSRKFWVAIVTGTVATILLLTGHIGPIEWKWAMGGSIVAYLGSQGIADAVSALKR